MRFARQQCRRGLQPRPGERSEAVGTRARISASRVLRTTLPPSPTVPREVANLAYFFSAA